MFLCSLSEQVNLLIWDTLTRIYDITIMCVWINAVVFGDTGVPLPWSEFGTRLKDSSWLPSTSTTNQSMAGTRDWQPCQASVAIRLFFGRKFDGTWTKCVLCWEKLSMTMIRAGVKYVLSNTNTNTKIWIFQIQIQIFCSSLIQIQIQIHLFKYKYKYKYVQPNISAENCSDPK